MPLKWRRLNRKPTRDNPMPYIFSLISPPPERVSTVARAITRNEINRMKREAQEWCEDQFGPANGDGAWSVTGNAILFLRDLEATAFAVRWC